MNVILRSLSGRMGLTTLFLLITLKRRGADYVTSEFRDEEGAAARGQRGEPHFNSR